MGYTYNFAVNQAVDAASLNAVATDLAGGAVSGQTTFSDGVLYGIDALNGISGDLTSKGVCLGVGSGCQATKSGESIKILSGTLFFETGGKVKIDAQGVTLTPQSGVKNYIWVENSAALGGPVFHCGAAAPAGDYVKIAELAADGTLTDCREIARSKISAMGANVSTKVTPVFTSGYHEDGEVLEEIYMDRDNYNYIIFGYKDNRNNGFTAYDLTAKKDLLTGQSGQCELDTEARQNVYYHGKILLIDKGAYFQLVSKSYSSSYEAKIDPAGVTFIFC